ncbi:MAG TPA: hypothetical protein VF282_02110 [Bacillota bacterium]
MERDDERLQVLKMIEGGQISAEEGVRLLAAVERGAGEGQDPERPRWLRVRVDGRGEKVNVNLPIAAVELVLGLVTRFLPRQAGRDGGLPLDPAEITRLIRSGARGRIVEVESEDAHVEVFVE